MNAWQWKIHWPFAHFGGIVYSRLLSELPTIAISAQLSHEMILTQWKNFLKRSQFFQVPQTTADSRQCDIPFCSEIENPVNKPKGPLGKVLSLNKICGNRNFLVLPLDFLLSKGNLEITCPRRHTTHGTSGYGKTDANVESPCNRPSFKSLSCKMIFTIVEWFLDQHSVPWS